MSRLAVLGVFLVGGAVGACGGDVERIVLLPPAVTLSIVAGNGQSANVRHPLSNALTIVANTPDGGVVPGVTVDWTVTSGGGTLSASSVITDAQGRASVDWTLGSPVGNQSVAASGSTIVGSPTNFSATAAAPIVLHYDGTSWSTALEDVNGALISFTSIWGATGSAVFAIGKSCAGPLALQYDGNHWGQLPASCPGNDPNQLTSVWGSSPVDLFATHRIGIPPHLGGSVDHYDGQNWNYVYIPPCGGTGMLCPSPQAVWSSSPSDVLAVGDAGMIKVHAHAPTPGPILDYCVSSGSVSRVIVENMEEQYRENLLAQSRPPIAAESISGIATVVVASGAGVQRVFESLGASRLVSGGATMNPSVQDLVSAIEDAAADNVIVLPNDKNILLAAQQAARLTRKAVRIVPSLTVPQGIAALLAFNFQADLDGNAHMMTRALSNVETGEITRAVRTVSIDGLDVQAGQVIGLLNGSLCAAGSDHDSVAIDVMQKMRIAEYEISSIYYGADVTPASAGELAAAVRRAFPHLEVDVHSGGQPHAHYIISAE